MTANLVIGDVFDALAEIPKGSVDLVLTSPPFLALRSYLPGDHSDKGREIGSEATPGEFLDTLLDVVEECAIILAPHGSLVFELGDTYSGSGGAGGDYSDDGLRAEQPIFDGSARRTRASGARTTDESRLGVDARNRARRGGNAVISRSDDWPESKSLCAIPALFEVALAYGLNPLTGRRTDRWRVRNQVVWPRPNPPVGALGDKFRPATSYMTVACKARDRWFDLDAVRVPSVDTRPRNTNGPKNAAADPDEVLGHYDERTTNPGGAPPLDYWVIPTQPYPGAHYATWPESLCVKPILSMCPERVCRVCGEPSRRIVEQSTELNENRPQARRAMELAEQHGLTAEHLAAVYALGITDAGKAQVTMTGFGKNTPEVQRLAAEAKAALGGYFREFTVSNPRTLGWTDCGHDDWRSGVVLDPFAGSGTTLQVATRLGRDAIGIDLDERNEDLIRQRIGLFMGDVSYVNKKGAASGSTQ